MFASFVPEIVDIVGRRERYGGTYDKPVGVRQVISLLLCLPGDHKFLNMIIQKKTRSHGSSLECMSSRQISPKV